MTTTYTIRFAGLACHGCLAVDARQRVLARLGVVMFASLWLLLMAAGPTRAVEIIRIAEHRAVRLAALKPLVPALEKKLGVEIRIVEYPSPALDYFTKLVTELRSGNAPDIFTIPRDQQLDDLAAAGYLADMSAALANWDGYSQLSPLVKRLGRATFDQVPYVVPSILTVEQLYYRRDILQQHNISTAQPQSWRELLRRAREIKTKTGHYALLFPAGLTWGAGSYTEGFRYLLAGSSDPELVNSKGQYRLRSDGVYEALKFYQDIIDADLMPVRPLLNPEPWVIPKYEMFPKGQLLSTTCGTWCVIFDWGPGSRNPIDNIEQVLGTWAMPARWGPRNVESGASGELTNAEPFVMMSLVYSWAVNAQSRHLPQARQVALELGSVDAAIAYAQKLGNVPARRDAIGRPEFQSMKVLLEARKQLAKARAVRTTVGANALMSGVARATESLLTKRKDARGAQQMLVDYVSNVLGDDQVEQRESKN